MIIFNLEEMENSFLTKDNEILQINSRLSSLKELAERLQQKIKGDENALSEEDFEMTRYLSGVNRMVVPLSTNEDTFDAYNYVHIFDPESEEGLDTMSEDRSVLFADFERFQYGQNHDFSKKEEALSDKELYESVLDALGVMPALYEELDLSIKELMNLSYLARNCYRPWEALQRDNRLPTKKDIVTFAGLNDYERDAFTSSMLNPTRLLDVIEGIKAKQGFEDFAITKENVHIIAKNPSISTEDLVNMITVEAFKVSETNIDNYNALKSAFEAEFRRAPRILNEIYNAFLPYYNVSALSDTQIAEIVRGFKLTNIQAIAKRHNPALLVMSKHLNFSETKKEHLNIFATYLTPALIKSLEEKGFIEWYKKYKREIKISELANIVRNSSEIGVFDLNISPKNFFIISKQRKGWINAACVYEDFGDFYDFRKNENVIPNRTLVIEDKSAGIRMRMLANDDARLFIAPIDCHCCQNVATRLDIERVLLAKNFNSIEETYQYVAEHREELAEMGYNGQMTGVGVGGGCTLNEIANPFACVTLWEDAETNNTIAQADTHYDAESNTLIYDNIEFANDGDIKKIFDILAIYAESSTFDNVHIGTGYNQGMTCVGKPIGTKAYIDYSKECKKYLSYQDRAGFYTDYHARGSNAARAIKKDGLMLMDSKKPLQNFKVSREEEETFPYLTHPLVLLFNDYTIAEKKDLIERYEAQNLTEREMIKCAGYKPNLLSDFDELPLKIQYAIVTDKIQRVWENLKYIKNPNMALFESAMDEKLANVRKFPAEKITKEKWMKILERDGTFIEFVPRKYYCEEMFMTAIKENPFSVKYIEKVCPMEDRNKYLAQAILRKPILISHYPDVSHSIWLKVLEKSGTFGRYHPTQPTNIQQAMIDNSPYWIEAIRNPDIGIVKQVAEKIPAIKTDIRYRKYFAGANNQLQNQRRTPRRATPVPAMPRTVEAMPAHSIEDDYSFSMEELA